MNPYEIPSTTTVTKCLQHWGTPEFEDEFLSELSAKENDLPLEDMCISGGYPSSESWAELESLKITAEIDGIVRGSFFVSFTEESPTGCRDHPWKDKRSGTIDFKLDLKSGIVEFVPPRLKREYEPDEF